MIIWNRSGGPGGGTRRLHHSIYATANYIFARAKSWGRIRIDVLNKEIVFVREDTYESRFTLVIGSKTINANENNRFSRDFGSLQAA